MVLLYPLAFYFQANLSQLPTVITVICLYQCILYLFYLYIFSSACINMYTLHVLVLCFLLIFILCNIVVQNNFISCNSFVYLWFVCLFCSLPDHCSIIKPYSFNIPYAQSYRTSWPYNVTGSQQSYSSTVAVSPFLTMQGNVIVHSKTISSGYCGK